MAMPPAKICAQLAQLGNLPVWGNGPLGANVITVRIYNTRKPRGRPLRSPNTLSFGVSTQKTERPQGAPYSRILM